MGTSRLPFPYIVLVLGAVHLGDLPADFYGPPKNYTISSVFQPTGAPEKPQETGCFLREQRPYPWTSRFPGKHNS
ncbi:hypothetical protein JTE90_001032 [Oedothorax gibbosus]|uniref:Uncharacterized protein n=1 Tax=Oedothorax gibbosus TaxID=931172 RepID=A0AAV6THG6_9ARAC|nr:hypothetical protein JTE90_001032 [Oedothorax gibbosus]